MNTPLDQLLTDISTFLDKPQKGIYAALDLLQSIEQYGYRAIVERDEDISHNMNLEAENAELRRLLRAHGIIYKAREDEAA